MQIRVLSLIILSACPFHSWVDAQITYASPQISKCAQSISHISIAASFRGVRPLMTWSLSPHYLSRQSQMSLKALGLRLVPRFTQKKNQKELSDRLRARVMYSLGQF